MKAMILIPDYYSLKATLEEGFLDNGWQVFSLDWEAMLPRLAYRVYKKTAALPRRLAKLRTQELVDWVNKEYHNRFCTEHPDLIMIYNNQMIHPDTIAAFKRTGAKICFVLGDNPLYSHTSDFNLKILELSDYTVCPDSGWSESLDRIGIPNICLDFIAATRKYFYQTPDIPSDMISRYKSDILFIGRSYSDSAGYKRTLFLSKFASNDLKIYGSREWHRWLPFFPELARKFHLLTQRLSDSEYNYAMNCCKIYPIDINPGIQNGIHLRVFEAISAGAYPLVEWTADLESIFGSELQYIKKFSDADDIAQKILQDENASRSIVESLQMRVNDLYAPRETIGRLIKGTYS